MALTQYEKKRRLAGSKEPAAKTAGSLGKRPIFVIQKHQASHLHYDLRLEADGVLKSWAVPKGFSGEQTRNLAIMVEDHPFAYRSFHGVIPPGNYGAGTVEIWDRGTYSIAGLTDKADIEQAAVTGIKKGRLTFFLAGKILSGEFALIKLKPRGRENSWLLIKSKAKFADDYARQEREEDRKEYLETKLRSDKIIKSVFPKTVEPMLAKLADQPFDRKGWLFEPKLDGYRAIAKIRPGKKAELLSRNQVSFSEHFPGLINNLETIKLPAVLDGEIVAVKKNGQPDFPALQNYLRTGLGNLFYYVFDILYLERSDLKNLPLAKRKEILKNLVATYLPSSSRVKYLDHLEEVGKETYQAAIRNGFEGMIAKDGASGYEQGRRTGRWLKIKKIRTQEAIIIGLTEPRGSRKHFGSLLLAAYDRSGLRYIGRSGGGFTDQELRELEKLLEKSSTAKKLQVRDLPEMKNIRWVRPKIVVEIKFAEWTPDGLMRQPVFLRLREDKGPADVKIEK